MFDSSSAIKIKTPALLPVFINNLSRFNGEIGEVGEVARNVLEWIAYDGPRGSLDLSCGIRDHGLSSTRFLRDQQR